jgi:hypothetical protein
VARPHFTRRQLIAAGLASSAVVIYPTPSQAILPAVLSALRVITTLWQAYRVGEEIYQRLFGQRSQVVASEVTRLIGQGGAVHNEFYRLENASNSPGLNQIDPGCQYYHQSWPQYPGLCCGSQVEAIAIPSGHMVALAFAIDQLSRDGYGGQDLFAYTRPIRYYQPPEPMNDWGGGYKSDLSYYTANGAVALQWYSIDGRDDISGGHCVIRDNRNSVIYDNGIEFSTM